MRVEGRSHNVHQYCAIFQDGVDKAARRQLAQEVNEEFNKPLAVVYRLTVKLGCHIRTAAILGRLRYNPSQNLHAHILHIRLVFKVCTAASL